jgi:hypothetical protein
MPWSLGAAATVAKFDGFPNRPGRFKKRSSCDLERDRFRNLACVEWICTISAMKKIQKRN